MKWDKTGVVIENKPHSQVLIWMDGSRKATLRNRKFVKQILPTTASRSQQPVAEAPAVQSQDRHATSVPVVLMPTVIPLRVPIRGKSEDRQGPSTTIEPKPVDFDHDVYESPDQRVTEASLPPL